ncbi:PAS domain S-box protein [Candidatus Reidiella endopervernicosa]|uniref:PAS domain S-box protein n=1 Tax=Candidatus Reidiella endopervernicosa TaxID=2738883 RepID=A0A6N0HX70_9GAMM|nr:PAS domain S-box protein [Candidatus Reidiella endopervernicosa]QKQ26975.1 PAS domain S-box protein [Candidatus Reidiella endopervernicosa]
MLGLGCPKHASAKIATPRQTHVWELRPTDLIENAKQRFDEFCAASGGETANLPFLQPGGAIVPVECRMTLVIDGDRRYMQCISRDITERKQAETRLLNEAKRAQALLELPHDSESLREGLYATRPGAGGELTESHDSFIHFVDVDNKIIELVTWTCDTQDHNRNSDTDSCYPISDAG